MKPPEDKPDVPRREALPGPEFQHVGIAAFRTPFFGQPFWRRMQGKTAQRAIWGGGPVNQLPCIPEKENPRREQTCLRRNPYSKRRDMGMGILLLKGGVLQKVVATQLVEGHFPWPKSNPAP